MPTARLFGQQRRGPLFAAVLLSMAAFAAYANSFSGPFVLDDIQSTVENPTIRSLWPPLQALSPPHHGGLTVEGRPVLNLSLAINHAISGDRVWSYHGLNVLIHLLAGLCLFGIVRRTLALRRIGAVPRGAAAVPATALAFCVALIWAVHPLQTESVTYVVQRAESLMGLFYLATLYFFIRYAESGASGSAGGAVWAWLSAACCLLGMATKEVMVSAPVMVLLYDRAFVAGGFREAWRRRHRIYLGLAATWLLLAYLVIGAGGNRGGSAGFGAGVAWGAYELTQFRAIAHYLGLAIWPHPLVFDYGAFWVKNAAQVVPFACIVLPLMAATLVALWKWPDLGFLGAWFFAILAPTSLIPGPAQMIAEHRMYLALIPVVVLAVIGVCLRLGRGTLPFCMVFAAALGGLTARRNEDYRTALRLWRDTVTHAPDNALARNNLGYALNAAGQTADAIAELGAALRLKPDYPDAHNNLGDALNAEGRTRDAIIQYREALRLRPDYAEIHYNLGNALNVEGRRPEAIAELETALRLEPDYASARNNLANILAATPGRLGEAIIQYEAALRLKPGLAETHYNLANALNAEGRPGEAIAQYEETVRLKPDHAGAHNNLANILAATPGRSNDAIAQYREALRLRPDYFEAHYNLAFVLNAEGRSPDAIPELEAALRLRPDYPPVHFNLAIALLKTPGRIGDAQAQLAETLRLQPENETARKILAGIRASSRP